MKPFHLLILFVLNSTLKQANGQWVTGGPYIQNVNCIAFSGNNIFVGTDGSAVNGEGPVYLSSDNCRSWTSVSNGLPPEIASSIVVADSGIFAALPLYGVYFSNNNGTSWTLRKSGLTNLNISCLALSGTNLFAGTNSGGVPFH